LRRAVRFGRQQLELREPFLHTLVPVVVQMMGGAFPELQKETNRVVQLIKDEEVSFSRTLDRGIKLFNQAYREAIYRASLVRTQEYNAPAIDHDLQKQRAIDEWEKPTGETRWAYQPSISGEDAFKLHATYGFPIDLTRIMAEERGLTVDIPGYEKLMEQAQGESGPKGSESLVMTLTPDAIAKLAEEKVSPTNDSTKFSRAAITATVRAIWNGDDLGLSPASAFEDEELAIILDRTNFYSEMGGQIGDAGELCTGPAIFDVRTTRIVAGYILHIGRLRAGKLRVGDAVTATVTGGRDRTEKNHTSTHLANWALREVFGEGVQQKGSLVDPEKLRFDFSHPKAMSDDEISQVESLVNREIQKKLPVYATEAPQELALKINGLRAVFGEKYPPLVRVVSIGAPVADLLANPMDPKWRAYSIEFCGGTHLKTSDEAGQFAIVAEESVSKGIRRLVALTGDAAAEALAVAQQIETAIASAKDLPDAQLSAHIATLQKLSAGQIPLRAKRRAQAAIAEIQAKHKGVEKAAKAKGDSSGVNAVAVAGELLAKASDIAGGKLVIGEIRGATDDQLRSAVDSLKKKTGSYAIMLAAGEGEKVTFVAAVSDDLVTKGLKAGDWVKETAKLTGGGGGGRPQMAQGSGKDPAAIPAALAAAEKFAKKI
jgi:alanyl-tRNA synthetase